jgi:outer membrane protein insertion porin family
MAPARFGRDAYPTKRWVTLARAFKNGIRLVLFLVACVLFSTETRADAEETVAVTQPWGGIVAELRFEGLNRTREYIVTRELVSRVGEPCLEENLDIEKQNLLQLDIFSHIDIEAEDGPDGVIIHYKFVELLSFLPSLGLKFSDETGVSAGAGVKVPNLVGKDIYLSARFLVGGYTELELILENPWVWGNHWGYKAEYYHREKENLVVNFNETSDEFYLKSGPRLGKYGKVGGIISLLSIRSDTDGVTIAPNNHDMASRLGLYVGYDSLDAFMGPTQGWWNEFVLTQAIEIFENSSSYTQVDLDLRRYQSLADRHTLAGFSLTTVRTGTVGVEVAPWEQFGIGGTNTVRGWNFASRKGKNQMLNTFEYRYTLLKPRGWDLPYGIKYRGGLAVAAFGDWGIGWDEERQFAANRFIDGYGVGLRLLIPIVGMARVDLAWGEHGETVFLHLGSYEKATAARYRVR